MQLYSITIATLYLVFMSLRTPVNTSFISKSYMDGSLPRKLCSFNVFTARTNSRDVCYSLRLWIIYLRNVTRSDFKKSNQCNQDAKAYWEHIRTRKCPQKYILYIITLIFVTASQAKTHLDSGGTELCGWCVSTNKLNFFIAVQCESCLQFC